MVAMRLSKACYPMLVGQDSHTIYAVGCISDSPRGSSDSLMLLYSTRESSNLTMLKISLLDCPMRCLGQADTLLYDASKEQHALKQNQTFFSQTNTEQAQTCQGVSLGCFEASYQIYHHPKHPMAQGI